MDPAAPRAIPTGRVALLFSDIQGSTALLALLGEKYGDVLDLHDRIMRSVFAEYDGYEFSNEGDAFGAAFADPTAAAAAALLAQRELATTAWPGGESVRVRMGAHLGEPRLRGKDYWGEDVHYTARVCSSAHGGQVVLSSAMRSAVPDLPTESLGLHGLKDFPTPRELFHLSVDGSRPADFPPLKSLSAFRSNLPSIATPLFGRDLFLAEIDGLMFEDRCRLVTVVGPGGIGKTRVAVALGERFLSRFTGGVSLVALAHVAAGDVDRAVADAIGAPGAHGHHDRAVIEHLRQRQALLILDNAEHLPGAVASLVGRLLDQCPDVAILVTSQTPLGIGAETVRRLPGLSVTDAREEEGAAVTMFAARARARDASFELTPANWPRIVDLARAVEGMPLAIELAAARVHLVGVDRLLEAFARDADALGTGPDDLPSRQRGLRAVLDWTVGLLDEQDRTAFIAFGAFARAWTIDQAERFLAGPTAANGPGLDPMEVWDVLSRLTDLSLAVPLGDGRFAMPERVRRHAVELLDGSSDRAWWHRRHADVLADEMRAIVLEMEVDFVRMMANAEDLMEDYLQALSWSRREDRDTYRHLLAVGATPLLRTARVSLFADDLPGLLPDCADELLTADDAGILYAVSTLNAVSMSKDVSGEIDLLVRATAAFERLGQLRDAIRTRLQLIDAYAWGGQHENARAHFQLVAGLVQRVGDERWVVEIAHFERMVLRWAGQYSEASELLQPWLRRPRGVGVYSQEVDFELSELLGHRGRNAEALALLAVGLAPGGRHAFIAIVHQLVAIAGHLAALGLDEEAVLLVAGAKSAYTARTGSQHRDGYVPNFMRDQLTEARTRLGDREPDVVRRGEELGYDEICDLALELIERHGSPLADVSFGSDGAGSQ